MSGSLDFRRILQIFPPRCPGWTAVKNGQVDVVELGKPLKYSHSVAWDDFLQKKTFLVMNLCAYPLGAAVISRMCDHSGS